MAHFEPVLGPPQIFCLILNGTSDGRPSAADVNPPDVPAMRSVTANVAAVQAWVARSSPGLPTVGVSGLLLGRQCWPALPFDWAGASGRCP